MNNRAPTTGREQRVGRYDLVARLAIGGMGELFLAREQGIEGFERLVVIKRILPNLAASRAFRQMFLREARLLARLNHPNVVQTVELGEDKGNYYLVLEYLQGSTLRELQVLAQAAQMAVPIGVVIGIVAQGLRGLHAAHELRDLQGNLLGTVHRDLTPHNLMCSPEGNVKLFDFGVAKATEHGEVTHSGLLKGKLAYMSPEQCRHEPIDRRSDIFSIGIVLWEFLAGRRLFKRTAEVDTLNAIADVDVPLLQELRPELPSSLCEIVHRALDISPDERWATAAELETALLDCAKELDLDTTVSGIAEFVEEVAADTLAARAHTLAAALERSLTLKERLALIHSTGGSAEDDALVADEVEETILVHPLSLTESGRLQEQTGEPSPTPKSRRWLAALVILALLALPVAWLAQRPSLTGPPVVIAWAPVQAPDVLRAEVAPIIEYLEEELGRPVTLVIPKDYQDAGDHLVDGTATFAVLPPYIYVLTKLREPAVRPLANQLFDGSKSSDGLLLVSDEGAYRQLEQLRGRTFCFSDVNSTTGALLPKAYLKSQGHDPKVFIGRIHWSGSHQQVLRDVLAGVCDVGATYSGNLMTADQYGIAIGQFQRLAITGTTPNEAVVAGPNADPELTSALQKALLEFDPEQDAGVDFVGESLRITGFSVPEEEKFDFIRSGIED